MAKTQKAYDFWVISLKSQWIDGLINVKPYFKNIFKIFCQPADLQMPRLRVHHRLGSPFVNLLMLPNCTWLLKLKFYY